MRERRAWPSREQEAESSESAAFEHTVAVVKETVVRSGQVLVSAQEDLSDHHRWLQAQSAAVEADRARHDRWLQRQREHRDALARKERARRKRQVAGQRIVRAINRSIVAAVESVRSLILLAIAKTIGGIAWVGGRIRDFALYIVASVMRAALSAVNKIKALLLALGHSIAAFFTRLAARVRSLLGASGQAVTLGASRFSAGTRALAVSAGEGIAAGTSTLTAKTQVAAASLGEGAPARVASLSAKTQGVAASLARGSSARFVSLSAKVRPFAISAGQSAAAGASRLSAGIASFGRQARALLASASGWAGERLRTFAPALYVPLAKAGEQAKRLASQAAVGIAGLLAKARPSRVPNLPGQSAPAAEAGSEAFEDIRVDGTRVMAPVAAPAVAPVAAVGAEAALAEPLAEEAPARAQNALSSPLRTGNLDLSQMLILAGVVLLICGGLLLGGGLVLRAASSSTASESESPHVIAWLFEDPDRTLDERIVFRLSGTPSDFRINGLSITGWNASDQSMTELTGIVKPDVRRPDLKLAPGMLPEGANDSSEAQPAVPLGVDGVPGHAFFRLTYVFPPEAMTDQDGLTVEEFAESYGGLTLKLRYQIEGREKTVIQYLPLEMLRGQLAEVKRELDGS
jgi:hypothetical protein